ncbi:MAG: GH3 family domain-containing protein [Weeksellaceae bacterium]
MKKILGKIFSRVVNKKELKWKQNPVEAQQNVFHNLINKGLTTQFGKDHHFKEIKTHADFVKNVPIRDYEKLKTYIDQTVEGKENVLWPGKPAYFAKTSGTTSGSKYIPISKESMPFHIKSARNALLNYIHEKGSANFVQGKMIFLQGSPILEEVNGVKTGRLSGIVAHYVPSYLQSNRMPSWETNTIEEWETKVDAIVEETYQENMTLVSGIPPWIIMYFERLQDKTSKKIGELFPNLELIVTGGVNFEPYRQKMNDLIGREVEIIQTYPASEGFIGYQDQLNQDDLLLLLNHGIFYEFVPVEEIHDENPTRLTIHQVALDVNYVLIMSTNAGLWAYNIGDTVKFTSLKPYRIVVSGRVKHYTSAFGEHVIGKEVENAMMHTNALFNIKVSEFHVAPQVNPIEGLPYHEWFIEFESLPDDLEAYRAELNKQMQAQNPYYDDLITGHILDMLHITKLEKNAFNDYMKSIGKLGGQFKLPRLANDRKIADPLTSRKISD